ncbi:uncharacterized protein [Nicotiana sylvestris]|uniref:uncharacterized protein n=1 Tax=Nicotiana sylvestris TaxID=4096 RepID=UPI00388C82C5
MEDTVDNNTTNAAIGVDTGFGDTLANEEFGVDLPDNHPLYFGHADTSEAQLIFFQLIGTDNYNKWNRSMRIALRGRNKLGLVEGTWKKEIFRENLWKQWERCNAILLSWLMNAEIAILYQGTSYVSDYYIKLKDLWDEFEALDPAPCDCEKSRDYVAVMKRQKLYQCLMGLNDSYAQERSQILLISSGFQPSFKHNNFQPNNSQQPGSYFKHKRTYSDYCDYGIEPISTNVDFSSDWSENVETTLNLKRQLIKKTSMSNKPPEWIIDTRATNHMVSDLKLLSKSEEIKPSNPKKDLYSGRVKEIGKEYNSLYMLIPHTNKSNQETTITVKDSTEPKEKVPIFDGNKYFLTLVDDFSRMTWLFLLKHKLDDFVSLNAHEVVPYAIANYVSYSGLSRKYQAYLATFSSIVEPATYTEASQDPRRVDAMKAEIEALEAITPETLSLFLKERSQLVVNDYIKSNTRPQGDLFDEIYMQFPPGFKSQGESQLVCRLHKFLYGLKQDPRQWNEKLREALYQFGFVESQYDHSLFIKQTTEGIMIVLVYADDMLVTDGILMHQRKYALEFISKLGLGEANPVATLLEVNAKLTTKEYDDHLGASSDVVDAKPVSTATKEVTYGGSNESC